MFTKSYTTYPFLLWGMAVANTWVLLMVWVYAEFDMENSTTLILLQDVFFTSIAALTLFNLRDIYGNKLISQMPSSTIMHNYFTYHDLQIFQQDHLLMHPSQNYASSLNSSTLSTAFMSIPIHFIHIYSFFSLDPIFIHFQSPL